MPDKTTILRWMLGLSISITVGTITWVLCDLGDRLEARRKARRQRKGFAIQPNKEGRRRRTPAQRR